MAGPDAAQKGHNIRVATAEAVQWPSAAAPGRHPSTMSSVPPVSHQTGDREQLTTNKKEAVVRLRWSVMPPRNRCQTERLATSRRATP